MTKKTNPQEEGMKLLRIEAENFKNITKRVVEIGGRTLYIIGQNAADKSSLIQVAQSALDTDFVPSEPIKKGERRATIRAVIGGTYEGEEKQYTIDMFFTPGNLKGRVVVTEADGTVVKNPKGVMNNVIGNISFDPFQFLRAPKKEKIKLWKQITGTDKLIDAKDAERKIIYDKRTSLNAVIEDQEARMNNHGISEEDIEEYNGKEPEDLEPIQLELDEISESIKTYSAVVTKVNGFVTSIQNHRATGLKAVSEIERLKKLLIEEEDKLALAKINICMAKKRGKIGEAWLAKNEEPSAKAISERLSEAKDRNVMIEKVAKFAEMQKELIKNKDLSETYTVQIEKIDREKEKIIEKADLPVAGMTIKDDEILLDGLPFEEGQGNTARYMEAGFEMSIALNKKFRCLFIKDASLMDKATRTRVVKMLHERGYHAMMELVKDEGELELKFEETIEE